MHMTRHHKTGTKVECDRCHKKFDGLNLMRKHQHEVDCQTPRKFYCDQCEPPSKYKSKGALENHITNVHGGVATSGRVSKKKAQPVRVQESDSQESQESSSGSDVVVPKKRKKGKPAQVVSFSTDEDNASVPSSPARHSRQSSPATPQQSPARRSKPASPASSEY